MTQEREKGGANQEGGTKPLESVKAMIKQSFWKKKKAKGARRKRERKELSS